MREPDDNGEISTGAEIHNGKCRPEIPYVDGVPMPPSVRPVIILQGSDYELGYQYYQQLVEIYGTWIPSHKWGYLYYCTPLHREDFSTEEKSALKEFQAYIDRYAPEWTAIFEGMAAGATDAGVPLTYEDLLAFFVLYEELYHWSPKSFIMPGSVGSLSGGEPARPACSGFAAWGSRTKDGKMLCVGNADDDSGFFASTVMVFPETGNNFITSPFDMPGFGGFPSHPGTNNKGLVYVHHGTGRFFFSDWGYTVPRGIADMHLLRFASNAEEAAEMHLAYPKAVNFKDGIFLADVGGDALVIESRIRSWCEGPATWGRATFFTVPTTTSPRAWAIMRLRNTSPTEAGLTKNSKGRRPWIQRPPPCHAISSCGICSTTIRDRWTSSSPR